MYTCIINSKILESGDHEKHYPDSTLICTFNLKLNRWKILFVPKDMINIIDIDA